MTELDIAGFKILLQTITSSIGDAPLDQALEDQLNANFPPDGRTFQDIAAACRVGIATGQMCRHENGGIKFGRVMKASPELANFSVDLVQMTEVKGPHHRHPRGEIDMIMPIDSHAKFDNRGAGWLVYGPDSAHHPTVTGGASLVLYLLPNGEIEFTETR